MLHFQISEMQKAIELERKKTLLEKILVYILRLKL